MVPDSTVTQLIVSRLDLLSEKLGVASKALWQVLLYRQQLAAIQQLVITMILLVFLLVSYRYLKKGIQNAPFTMKYGEKQKDLEILSVIIPSICLAVSLVSGTIAFFTLLSVGVGRFFNPEYYALLEISNILR